MPPKRKARGKVKVEETENIPPVPAISGSENIKVKAPETTTTTRRSARVAAGNNNATTPTASGAASIAPDDQETAKDNVRKKRKTKATNPKAEVLATAPANATVSTSEGSSEAVVSKESAPTTVRPTPVNASVSFQPAALPRAPTTTPPPGTTSIPPPPTTSSSTIPPAPMPGSISAQPQPKKRIRNSTKMLTNNNILPPLPPPDCLEYIPCGIMIQDDEDEDEDEDEDLEHPKPEDPNEKTSPSASPASKWFISRLGADRLGDMCEGCMNRCPDAFGMHIYNDFWGYGIIEVMENWALDWAKTWNRYKSWKGGKLNRMAMAKARKINKLQEKCEAAGGDREGWEQEKPKWDEKEGWEAVKELWVITEAFVVWLGKGFDQHYMVDDGKRVMALYELLTAMLSGTFHLLNDIHETHKSEENPRPLVPIKNLGLMCACAISHHTSINPDDDDVDFRPMVYRYAKRWGELEDAYVREMVEKGIKVDEIDEEELEDKKSSIETCVKAEKMLADYKASYASSPPSILYRPPRIGGNSYDITKMSESEKREYKYDSGRSPSPW